MGKPDCFQDISAVEKRAKDLQDWLKKNAPGVFSDQKHLDEGTPERNYWNYGYMVALRDVLRFLTTTELPSQKRSSADNSSSYPLA